MKGETLDPAQIDAAFHPLSFDAAQDNAFSYPTSSASANAAQVDAYATSSNAFRPLRLLMLPLPMLFRAPVPLPGL